MYGLTVWKETLIMTNSQRILSWIISSARLQKSCKKSVNFLLSSRQTQQRRAGEQSEVESQMFPDSQSSSSSISERTNVAENSRCDMNEGVLSFRSEAAHLLNSFSLRLLKSFLGSLSVFWCNHVRIRVLKKFWGLHSDTSLTTVYLSSCVLSACFLCFFLTVKESHFIWVFQFWSF